VCSIYKRAGIHFQGIINPKIKCTKWMLYTIDYIVITSVQDMFSVMEEAEILLLLAREFCSCQSGFCLPRTLLFPKTIVLKSYFPRSSMCYRSISKIPSSATPSESISTSERISSCTRAIGKCCICFFGSRGNLGA